MALNNQIDWEPDDSSSGEEQNEVSPAVDAINFASIRLNLNNERTAKIVYNSLRIDKEPKRSKAVRELSVDGQFLVANITCTDSKYLQKSIANFFDMCQLAKSTVELVGAYQFSPPSETNDPPMNKKRKDKK